MRIFTIFLFLFIAFNVKSQDIPLFSQKLTNSFIYNPAMAGIGLGSLTFSHRNNYSGVTGAPSNNFMSFHTPFSNYRFGAGFNVFQEEVAAIKSTYASGAFAYHININKFSSLSFGVSGEYNSSRLTDEAIAQNDGSDLILNRYTNGVAQPDFSFGVNYQNRLWKVGVAANRLYTAWFEKDSVKNLASYYSGFLQGVIPLEGARSVIEPYFAYRKFSESNNTFDIGVYYTYDNKLTAGVATRSGSILNATLAYKLTKNLLIGYSREVIMGSVGGYTGSSNELPIEPIRKTSALIIKAP
jgi:type IX secretion system PorP/SprF family membrane protein